MPCETPTGRRAGAALLTLVSAAASIAAAPIDDGDRSLALLRELERRQVTIEVQELALDRVLDDIAAQTGLPMRVDWDALGAIGIDDDDEVTVRFRGVPASSVLGAVMLTVGDELARPVVEAGGGQIVITAPMASEPLHITRAYDVGALFRSYDAVETTLEELSGSLDQQDRDAASARGDTSDESFGSSGEATADDGNGAGGVDDGGGDGDGDDPTDPERVREVPHRDRDGAPARPDGLRPRPALPDFEETFELDPDAAPPALSDRARIVRLIMDHVDPDAWYGLGGSDARLDEINGVLLMTATPRLHLELETVLHRLQALRPTSVPIEAIVARVPTDGLELARRRHPAQSVALVRSVLNGRDIDVLWRTRLQVEPGEALLAAGPIADDDAGDSATVRLEVETGLEPGTGRLGLDVRLTVHGADACDLATTLELPVVGGTLLRLPGSDDGTALVLLLLTG